MNGLGPRPAVETDLDDVFRIGARRFAAHWSRESLTEELGRGDSVFLVVPKRGYALARVNGDVCELFDLAVDRDGMGWGRALWAALLAEAMKRGCTKVALEVSAANERALRFYGKAGAVVAGRRPKFYTDGSDAVLMDLALP